MEVGDKVTFTGEYLKLFRVENRTFTIQDIYSVKDTDCTYNSSGRITSTVFNGRTLTIAVLDTGRRVNTYWLKKLNHDDLRYK